MPPRMSGSINLMEVLNAIIESASDLASRITHRENAYSRLCTNTNKQWTKTQFSRSLSSLKRSGYICFNQNNSVEYTNKAELKHVEKNLDRLLKDDKYRFISFDVPEPKRSQRDSFRRVIKRLGFKQIQKSLWVCNHDISHYVELAAREYGLEKYIVYIVSEASDIDNTLKIIFKKKC